MFLLFALASVHSNVQIIERHGVEYLRVGEALYATRGALEPSYEPGESGSGRLIFDGGRIVNQEPAARDTRNASGVVRCGIDWVRLGRPNEHIDFQALLTEWLKDDDKWGGHADANQIRYMATYGGIFGSVHQVAQEPDQSALAVLSVHEESPSGQPIGAQFLIRLSTHPFHVELVRPIRHSGEPWIGMPYAVLFPYGKHLLSIEGNELDDLAQDGKVLGKWLALPARSSVKGIAANRWLICQVDSDKGTSWTATDLERRRSFPVLTYTDEGPGTHQPTLYGGPSASSRYLLFGKDGKTSEDVTWFTIRLPDGLRTRLQGPAYDVAGPYAFNRKENGIEVYNAASGKLIGRNLK
jgi:hypothetical protein